MHFHLPKPLHSWREFAGEVGIIVLGVMIALTAEQLLSSVHQSQAVNAARDNIRAEIKSNLTSLASRKQNEPCVSQRLDEISSALANPALLKNAPVWIGHPVYAALRNDQLHSTEQAGHANLLARDEQAQYARIYALFAEYADAQGTELRAWADLRVLEQHPALTPIADWQLRSALQQARTARWMMEAAGYRALRQAADIGIDPDPVKPWPLQSACLPLNTPRAKGLAEIVAGRPGGAVYDEP